MTITIGTLQANFYGSMMMASTTRVGTGPDGRDVHVPIASLLPLVNPCDLILGGWDISRHAIYVHVS